MRIDHHGWRFTRQLGIGELEHVRTRLLGIACFHHQHLVQQATGAVLAGNQLGMLTRVHVNKDRLSREEFAGLVGLFGQHAHQQLELWPDMPEDRFMKKLGERVEIFIEPTSESTPNPELIKEGVLQVWKESGGRVLNGNFSFTPREQVKLKHPSLFPDLHPHYLAFQGQQE